ncbi:MAG: hypothetical protein HRU14_12430 [Planctomycetes bacterium]|nr:hypothetical protein [Planctomycetota bacterium]
MVTLMAGRRRPRLLAFTAVLVLLGSDAGVWGQGGATSQKTVPWTVLIYAAVDNDWERPFMRDVRGMRKGLQRLKGMEVILLVDRSPRYSRDKRALGEDFAGTRMYRLTGGLAERLDGGQWFPGIRRDADAELNMGSARTLRDFIRFGKSRYPATQTALFLVSHGEGMSFCPDETDDDDQMFTAELSDVLGPGESVEVLGFDACLMGGVENAYQWRPGSDRFGADYLVASAPVSSSWPYADIFAALGSRSRRDVPSAADLSRLIVDELKKQISSGRSGERGLERDLQAWGAFELKHAAKLKEAVDALAVALWKENEKQDTVALRGSGLKAKTFVYVWPERGADANMPHVDVRHFADRISKSTSFSKHVRKLASQVADAADDVVLHSVGFDHYKGFKGGHHGLYFVFPDGDKKDRRGRTYWQKIPWYDARKHGPDDDSYGSYAWCSDGSVPGNRKVETWFELMDAWFDAGDSNGYAW